MARVAASLRALLAHSIDYAGLFPPASLDLETALRNFASYVRSDDAWMLSTFVLPIAKFADAAWFLSEFNEKYPLRISALGPKTMNETDFSEELKNVAKGIEQLAETGSVRVEQLEKPLPIHFDEKTFARVNETVGAAASFSLKPSGPGSSLPNFWEAPAADAERAISFLAEQNTKRTRPLGFKLRSGGVTPDAFPTSEEIAHALIASAKHKVPIKFTAGLHHPVRMFRDEVGAKMHGFLNVLGAGVLGIEHQWSEDQTIATLEDEDAAAFAFTPETFRWRDFEIDASAIKKHRALITSFGSCSFDEPREDLRSLGLL
jgi:hypothetical protein